MPRLARVVCRAGITGAFDEAARQLEEDHGVVVGGETVRRVTESVGMVAEAAHQEDRARARRGALTRPPGGAVAMVVAVHGCQAPLRDGWHEMKVGRAAPLGPALRTDHRSGRTFLAWGEAAVCATLEGAEDFWWRVAVTAWHGGLGQQTRRVVVLGDGAEWIWNRAAHFLGGPGITVVEILDLFHAYEHLWEAGRAVFDAPDALAAWAEPLKDALYEEGAPAVLAALDVLAAQPLALAAAEVLRREHAYFADNAARMDYSCFVAQELPIGSGAVESLCKTLIEAREKGAGMRWTRARSNCRYPARLGRWGCLLGDPPAADTPPAVPPGPPTSAGPTLAPPLARPTPPVAEPLPSVTPIPAHHPAATHPWRRTPLGRACCA